MSPIAPIPDVPEPPKVPRSWGLGAMVENSLTRFFVQGFNRAKDGIAELIRSGLERLLESLEVPLVRMVGPVFDDVLASPGLPSSVRNLLLQSREAKDQAAIVALAGAVMALVIALFPAAISGIAARLSQASFQLIRPNVLDFNVGYNAQLRDPQYRALFIDNLQRQGWTDEQVAAAELATAGWLDLNALFSLWRREEITEAQFEERLLAGGMAPTAVPMWKKLKDLIPGPGDLVRFALREVWRPDVVAKWGYDQAWVTEFGDWMKKQGLSEEWARAYWRAHWIVPTAAQGFEMMWREVITDDDLEELLKINDIAPGWIPKLMQVARPVPGRIDRRYAYREGEIGWDQLHELYKFDGYTDEWATILANTTAKMAVSEAKGLTRAAVVAAYKKRRLSSAEAIGMLDDIGIPGDVAAFFLSQADSDRADQLLDRRIDAIGKQYLVGDLTESQTREALAALQVLADEIVAYLEEWTIDLSTKIKRPSRTSLDKFYLRGVVGVEQYRDQMDRLGYSALYVDWYLASLAIERQAIAEKEEREARVEQERIEKARIKSAYQIAKAAIDVDVAELQAAIASAQVALIEAQNERDRRLSLALPASLIASLEREYQPLLFDADAAISEARLEIAQLQTNIREKREAISLVDRSLIEGRDMVRYARLRGARLDAQTEQSRFGELIALNKVAIAQLTEAIPALGTPVEVAEAKARILALQTEIAVLAAAQAEQLVIIREIEELLEVELSLERRQELAVERVAFVSEIASLETDIAWLREEIRGVQRDRESLERELEEQITALPGAEDQIAIRFEFRSLIGGIQGRIKAHRENIAELRIEKSQLSFEYRSVS